jgi:hypothetical protein
MGLRAFGEESSVSKVYNDCQIFTYTLKNSINIPNDRIVKLLVNKLFGHDILSYDWHSEGADTSIEPNLRWV